MVLGLLGGMEVIPSASLWVVAGISGIVVAIKEKFFLLYSSNQLDTFGPKELCTHCIFWSINAILITMVSILSIELFEPVLILSQYFKCQECPELPLSIIRVHRRSWTI